jgi:hypothetical protein
VAHWEQALALRPDSAELSTCLRYVREARRPLEAAFRVVLATPLPPVPLAPPEPLSEAGPDFRHDRGTDVLAFGTRAEEPTRPGFELPRSGDRAERPPLTTEPLPTPSWQMWPLADPPPSDGAYEEPVTFVETPLLLSTSAAAADEWFDVTELRFSTGDYIAAARSAEQALAAMERNHHVPCIEERQLLLRVFERYLGPLSQRLRVEDERLAAQQLSRGARILVEGFQRGHTIAEVVDGSGLDQLQALRLVVDLVSEGLLRD